MPGPVFRTGDNVELRTIEEEDVEFLQEHVNDPRVRHSIGATEPISRAGEEEWIDSLYDGGHVQFLVCIDGDSVGTIGMEEPNDAWGTTEVGYMIRPEHWGNGYATDALRSLCGYAFEERRLAKVVGQAYATNPASSRVMEKVGFTKEGVLRAEAYVEGERVDVNRYGLLAEEWFEG